MPKTEPRLLHPGWTLILPFLALTFLMLCPKERLLYTSLISTTIYALMQWIFPPCRLRIDHYLCPLNIAIVLMFLRLAAVPMLVMTTGPESRVLSVLPSLNTMEGALLIDTLAYTAFCLSLALAPRRLMMPRSPVIAHLLSETPGRKMTWSFAAIGMLGFFWAFGIPSNLLLYFSDPDQIAELHKTLEGTWIGLFSTILRPFFAYALVSWWSRVADESIAQKTRKGASWRPVIYGFVAAVGITAANLTFSFNRAAFVFPLICLTAVYSARVRRIPFGATVMAIVIFLPALIAVETYRAGFQPGAKKIDITLESVIGGLSENIQAYSPGPQYAGLFYDKIGWGEHLYFGSTIRDSIMTPVPLLGKSFRETNGPALFNFALYGVHGIEDQIIPYAAELFANFHAPGVIAGFMLLGLFLSQAERWFYAAPSTFAAFSIQYVSMWAALLVVWSISVFSQIMIYFFCPIYFYLAVFHARAWLRAFQPSPSPALYRQPQIGVTR